MAYNIGLAELKHWCPNAVIGLELSNYFFTKVKTDTFLPKPIFLNMFKIKDIRKADN